MVFKLLVSALALTTLSGADAFNVGAKVGRREVFSAAGAATLLGVPAMANAATGFAAMKELADAKAQSGRKADQSAIGTSRVPPLTIAKGNPGAGMIEVKPPAAPDRAAVVVLAK